MRKRLDIGDLAGKPYCHEAVYAYLNEQGITCDGLITADGGVEVVNPSAAIELDGAARQRLQEIVCTIDADAQSNALIEAEAKTAVREQAVERLKRSGKLSADFKPKG